MDAGNHTMTQTAERDLSLSPSGVAQSLKREKEKASVCVSVWPSATRTAASTNCSPGTSPACQADISGVAFAALTLAVATFMLVMTPATPALATDPTAPSFGQDSYAFRVNENTPTRTVVGTVAATDSDGDILTYSVGGTDATEFNEVFDLNTSTGEITVKPGASIDYESGKHSYSVDVMVTDGEDDSGVAQSPPTPDATVPVIIEIINVNETGDGMLTLSTSSPRVGVELRATLTDPDGVIGGIFRSVWAKADLATGPFIPYESNTELTLTHTPKEAVQYKYLRLTVFYFDRACPNVYSIGYEYGQRCLRSAEVVTDNPVQDRLGLIIQSQKVNTPATGKVLMTGRPLVGHTLYAKARHIYDPDGTQALASRQTSLRWQWYRIDPMTLAETEVASVHNFWWEYVIQTADRGKAIQARVSFLDDTGNREVLKGALQSVPAPPNTVATNAPRVTGSPGLSEAGADGMWTAGETVQVTLTWNEAVTVDTTGGVPSIALDLGGTVFRRAAYSSGSGTTTLTFSYTLIDADGSHMSLLVPIDSLALNGGAILSQATATDAALAHSGAAKIALPPQDTQEQIAPRDEDEEDPFTASFSATPQTHNGADAFTVELHFSEAPQGLSYTTVAGGLLDVTGATVQKARRLTQGSNLAWEVTVAPSQSGDITIRLPTRACGEANAVCVGTRALERAATATVRGVPFTASFSGVPAEHDGATAFDIRFHLSTEPAGLSYRTVQSGLFAVTGGRIEKANRLVAGKNNGWNVRIDPTGLGDVTVRVKATTACDTAPGVCTTDGRKLAGGLSVSTAGPPTLSVADATVEESADATLAFTVTLSKARFVPTTVQYATSDGSAAAGSDYTAQSGTLTFGPLETSKTVSVPVLDDVIDEGSETLTLTLSNASDNVRLGDATATGTITNSDPFQHAWLARFGRTVGTHVTDAVGERLRAAPGQSSHVTVGGYRLPLGKSKPGAAESEADPLTALVTGLAGLALGPDPTRPGFGNTDPRLGQTRPAGLPSVRLRDVLLGSSFRLNVGADPAGGLPSLTAWGRVAGTQFDGRDGLLTIDGDVLTGTAGVDGTWDRWLAGVAMSHSRGDGSYAGATGRGEVAQTLTSIHPYLRYAVTDRLDVWGLLGYGWGELELKPTDGRSLETDTEFLMGSIGSRGILLPATETGGFELATRTDAMFTRTTSDAVSSPADRGGNMAGADGAAHRVRLILEGSREVTWAEGRSLKPTMEVGLRHDWGDAETGFGVELGGRIRYADPRLGLTIEGAVRGLLAHEDNDYDEWGASGSLRIAPGSAGQGLALTLAPTWGAASSGVDGLWTRQTTAGLAQTGAGAPAGRLNAEVGYGFAAFDTGLLTPYAGAVLSDGAARTYRLGTRLLLPGRGATGLALTLEGQRQEPAGQQPLNQGLRLQATWGF